MNTINHPNAGKTVVTIDTTTTTSELLIALNNNNKGKKKEKIIRNFFELFIHKNVNTTKKETKLA